MVKFVLVIKALRCHIIILLAASRLTHPCYPPCASVLELEPLRKRRKVPRPHFNDTLVRVQLRARFLKVNLIVGDQRLCT